MTTCLTSDTHDKSALTSATKGNQGMNRKTDLTEITCKRLKRAWLTESLTQCRLGMALKSVFASSVIFLFPYCEGKPENCSETRCKLLPTGGGFAPEFRLKSSQKGVRMVYLDLKFGNDSYHPLKDDFLRWVSAGKISEPMLSLSFDCDILSLGLLTYQVRQMDLQLEDQPNGCLATLNSSCQNIVIGRMLLNETEHSSGSDEVSHDTDVVCVAVIEENGDFYPGFFDGNVVYHCCQKSEQASVMASSIEWGLVPEISGWFKFCQIMNLKWSGFWRPRRSFSWEYCCYFIFYSLFLPIIAAAYLVPLSYSFFRSLLLWTVCYIGLFIVRMSGFIIMGLVLNAEIVGPFGTFVVVAAASMNLCYHNSQDRYKEVKQIISKQWQKHRNLLINNNLSNSEEGTIPRDLFWHVCDDESKSKHKVLTVRSEIFKIFRIMALILMFLFLSLCSFIFFSNTYNVTAVASTIAKFVSGKIPALFFKELTKKEKCTGQTMQDFHDQRNRRSSERVHQRKNVSSCRKK